MKKLSEFKPLVKLIGKYKYKLIIASILIFINGIFEICTGYLNGSAVEAITQMNLKKGLIFLGIYFIIEVTIDVSDAGIDICKILFITCFVFSCSVSISCPTISK